WFKPEPFFAQNVKDWKPGETLEFQPTECFPQPLRDLPPGKYYVQAIVDHEGGQSALSSPGNGYSKAIPLELDFTKGTSKIDLTIDQVVQPRKFVEKDNVKLVDIESKLLTDFHGRPTRLRAGVVLPKSFATEPRRFYPVVYEIPGFGGDHFMAFGVENRKATD